MIEKSKNKNALGDFHKQKENLLFFKGFCAPGLQKPKKPKVFPGFRAPGPQKPKKTDGF